MQEHPSISKATVDRLPRYYRCLRQLSDEGVSIASSEELGRRLSINPEQIRKDLTAFGQFGKKGVGYYVAELKESIGGILGLDQHLSLAIVGLGHLGAALANYQGIARLGVGLAASFASLPAAHAQQGADQRVAAGISGIWNFAPVKLHVPPSVPFVSEDLSVGLSALSYYLTHRSTENDVLSEKNYKESLIK